MSTKLIGKLFCTLVHVSEFMSMVICVYHFVFFDIVKYLGLCSQTCACDLSSAQVQLRICVLYIVHAISHSIQQNEFHN
jgi:hypothetical protein